MVQENFAVRQAAHPDARDADTYDRCARMQTMILPVLKVTDEASQYVIRS
jgi:hypothetical protein